SPELSCRSSCCPPCWLRTHPSDHHGPTEGPGVYTTPGHLTNPSVRPAFWPAFLVRCIDAPAHPLDVWGGGGIPRIGRVAPSVLPDRFLGRGVTRRAQQGEPVIEDHAHGHRLEERPHTPLRDERPDQPRAAQSRQELGCDAPADEHPPRPHDPQRKVAGPA